VGCTTIAASSRCRVPVPRTRSTRSRPRRLDAPPE
jgi:hypothetical protein